MGNFLANINDQLGHKVVRLNMVNDLEQHLGKYYYVKNYANRFEGQKSVNL